MQWCSEEEMNHLWLWEIYQIEGNGGGVGFLHTTADRQTDIPKPREETVELSKPSYSVSQWIASGLPESSSSSSSNPQKSLRGYLYRVTSIQEVGVLPDDATYTISLPLDWLPVCRRKGNEKADEETGFEYSFPSFDHRREKNKI